MGEQLEGRAPPGNNEPGKALGLDTEDIPGISAAHSPGRRKLSKPSSDTCEEPGTPDRSEQGAEV